MDKFQFATLENVEKTKLIDAFNASFADYFVPIKLTEESLADKIASENIRLEKSVGAFANAELIGFILIGTDESDGEIISYNGGTGVLPNFRGQKLTNQMYQFILPKLKAEGINLQRLEVITKNIPAIKTYEKIGFQTERILACFKGNIGVLDINQNVELKELDEVDDSLFPLFWNSSPSWQNSLPAVKRLKNQHKIIGAFEGENLVGYIIFTQSGRIKQFAVSKDFRRQRIGQTLFNFAKNSVKAKEFVITNIDKNDSETVSFLEKLGFNLFLEQFEMKLYKS